jgi:hypothetical protein
VELGGVLLEERLEVARGGAAEATDVELDMTDLAEELLGERLRFVEERIAVNQDKRFFGVSDGCTEQRRDHGDDDQDEGDGAAHAS